MIEPVCEILKAQFREDCIYRISGDEFVVIWSDVDYLQFNHAVVKVAAVPDIGAEYRSVWLHMGT